MCSYLRLTKWRSNVNSNASIRILNHFDLFREKITTNIFFEFIYVIK